MHKLGVVCNLATAWTHGEVPHRCHFSFCPFVLKLTNVIRVSIALLGYERLSKLFVTDLVSECKIILEYGAVSDQIAYRVCSDVL